MPQLANREKREELNEQSDALSRAKTFVQMLRKSNKRCLPTAIRQEILERFPEIVRFGSGKKHEGQDFGNDY